MKMFKRVFAVALALLMIFTLAACGKGGKVDLAKLLDDTVDFASKEGAKKAEIGQQWLNFLGDEANKNVDAAKTWVDKQTPEVLEKTKGSLDTLLEWGTKAIEGGEGGLKELGLDKLIGGKLPDISKWKDMLGQLIEMISGKIKG